MADTNSDVRNGVIMEMLDFNVETDDLILKINGSDFNQLADLVSGICSIYSKLDETILGMDAKRANELCDELYAVLRKLNNILAERHEK